MKPHKLKRVTVKEELVALTGNYISALMLNQFIYWSERTKDADEYIEEEKTRNPETDIELLHGWVYKKADQLNEELMLDLSATTIRRYIVKLIDSSLLRERHNPKQKYDRTLQYRPDILEIQRQLHVLGYALEGYALYASQGANLQNEDCNQLNEVSRLQNVDLKLQNIGAIPEITPEITTEITHTRGVCEEKTFGFGFGIGSSTGILVAPSSNHVSEAKAQPLQKSEELQIVSVDQNSAVPLLPTKKYAARDNSGFNTRSFNPIKGCDRSCTTDPWMDSARNPNRHFVQWILSDREQKQKSLPDSKRVYTPTKWDICQEIRNNVDRAADLWEGFLEAMHQRFEVYQTRVAAGIPIAAEEQNAIAQIASYANLVQQQPISLPTLTNLPMDLPLLPPEQPTNLPMLLSDQPTIEPPSNKPEGAYGGADTYKEFVAPPVPSEEESLRGKEWFIQQRVKNFTDDNFPSMPKSKFVEMPTTDFAKYRTWLHSDESALRTEAIAWVQKRSNDLEIEYDESGNIIDFEYLAF